MSDITDANHLQVEARYLIGDNRLLVEYLGAGRVVVGRLKDNPGERGSMVVFRPQHAIDDSDPDLRNLVIARDDRLADLFIERVTD